MLSDVGPCGVDIAAHTPLQQHIHSHFKSHTQTPRQRIPRMNKLQAFHLTALEAVHLQNELHFTHHQLDCVLHHLQVGKQQINNAVVDCSLRS